MTLFNHSKKRENYHYYSHYQHYVQMHSLQHQHHREKRDHDVTKGYCHRQTKKIILIPKIKYKTLKRLTKVF